MSTHGNKLAWIQALRGVAALMVMLVHDRGALVGNGGAGRAVANALLPMAMGVDLFFLISGFLMVLTTRDFYGGRAYAWAFAAKRIARIWPLYAIVTLLAIAVDQHGLHGFVDWAVLAPYLEGLLFVPHDPAASGLYFQMAVGVAWTLCFECYFYLVFALCMLFGRWRYAVMAGWFGLTLIAVPVLRGGFNLGVATQPLVAWSRYANLAINPMVWEFVLGMLAGWLYLSCVTIRRNAVIYASAMLLTVVLLLGWHRLGLMNFFGPAGWGAPLTVLFFGAVLLAKKGDLSAPATLVWLGEISYSLYLIHVYVFELVQQVAVRVPMSNEVFRAVLLIARPVVAVMGAWILFRYIEVPVSAWMRRRLLRHAQGRMANKSLPAWPGAESPARHVAGGP